MVKRTWICLFALLAGIGIAISVFAADDVLVITGTLKWYDNTVAPDQSFDVVKMDERGAEIIILRSGKPLPPPGHGKSGSDGRFRVEVAKNQFGSDVIRVGVKLPGEPPRYARYRDGRVAVIEAPISDDSLELPAGQTLYVKKR